MFLSRALRNMFETVRIVRKVPIIPPMIAREIGLNKGVDKRVATIRDLTMTVDARLDCVQVSDGTRIPIVKRDKDIYIPGESLEGVNNLHNALLVMTHYLFSSIGCIESVSSSILNENSKAAKAFKALGFKVTKTGCGGCIYTEDTNVMRERVKNTNLFMGR